MRIITSILAFTQILLLVACGTPQPNSSSVAVNPSSISSLPSSATVSSSSSSSSSSVSSTSAPTGSLVFAINVGSNDPTTDQGTVYERDRHGSGCTANATTDPISGSNEDTLFQSECYGDPVTYNIPVTNATYTVVMHFVEMYQTSAGNRIFSVDIENKNVLSNMDLFSTVGHDTAYSRTFTNVQVNDEKLTINLTASEDNATLSGIAIYSANGGQYLQPVSNGSVCPTTGPCKILPLGDSITDGIGQQGGFTAYGGYRIELFNLAVQAGKDITFVGSKRNGPTTVAGKTFPQNHEGYSGWTIQQINGLIPSPALNDPPNIILLHIGTNDLNGQSSGMETRLAALIDKIFDNQPDVLLVVAQIIPFNGAQAFNQKIPAIVQQRAEQGFKIIVVDQFTGFPTSELGDGVHPNAAGYARMAKKWFDAIEEYLP